MEFFSDDSHIIGVKGQDGKTALLVSTARDIFPVLHYLEIHPEARGNGRIEKLNKPLPENTVKSAQQYAPRLRVDSMGNTYAYQNYHFIFLNTETTHTFTQIVSEYGTFLTEMTDFAPRKIQMRNLNPRSFFWLEKIARMKRTTDQRNYFMPSKEHFLHYRLQPHAMHISPLLLKD